MTMSRSFKKVPGHVDRSSFNKNQANRRVRRYKRDLQSGGTYKKLYEKWNICDYRYLIFTPLSVWVEHFGPLWRMQMK